MRKALHTKNITTDGFINSVENNKKRGRPKKEQVAARSTLSQTIEDIAKRDDLVDCVSNLRDENGRKLSMNYSEAASLGYESALYLYEHDNEAFEKLVKKLKLIR